MSYLSLNKSTFGHGLSRFYVDNRGAHVFLLNPLELGEESSFRKQCEKL